MSQTEPQQQPPQQHLGGLWCHEVLALLTRYLDGDLSADELAGVKVHVAGCDACARFGSGFAGAIAKLRADDTREERTDDELALTARILAAVDGPA